MEQDIPYEIQWRTDFSALANMARLGLKYTSRSDKREEAPELLGKGMRLCTILSKASEVGQKEKIVSSEIPYHTISQVLIDSGKNLDQVGTDSTRVLEILESGRRGEKILEEDFDYANSFLVGVSEIYQKSAWRVLKSLTE